MPDKRERGTIAEGLRVEMEGWLDPVRILTPPVSETKQAEARVAAPTSAALTPPTVAAPTPITEARECVLSWDSAWTPWAIAGLLCDALLGAL